MNRPTSSSRLSTPLPIPTVEEDITLAVHDFVNIDHPHSVVVEALGALDLVGLAPEWIEGAWLGVQAELHPGAETGTHEGGFQVTVETDPIEVRHAPCRRPLRWWSTGRSAPPDVDADIEAVRFGEHSTHLILVGLARVHGIHPRGDELTPDRRRVVAAFSRTVLFDLARAICAHSGRTELADRR